MPTNVLADKLRAGRTVLGVANMFPASGIIECMAKEWDFVWIDGQHGQHNATTALPSIQAAEAHGVGTLLRVPGHEYGILGPFADQSPSAIMVPMVDTVEDAQRVVDGLCFPPVGRRSFGGRRAVDVHGRSYHREAEMLVVAQIETLEASANAEAIITTQGIDALFFGPDDMKLRMGIPLDTPATEHEELRAAMAHTAAAATAAGKIAGTVIVAAAQLPPVMEMGYRMVVGGGDSGFMRSGSAAMLAELRAIVGNGP